MTLYSVLLLHHVALVVCVTHCDAFALVPMSMCLLLLPLMMHCLSPCLPRFAWSTSLPTRLFETRILYSVVSYVMQRERNDVQYTRFIDDLSRQTINHYQKALSSDT